MGVIGTHTVEVPLLYRSESNCLQKHICIKHAFSEYPFRFSSVLVVRASLFGVARALFFGLRVLATLLIILVKSPQEGNQRTHTKIPT